MPDNSLITVDKPKRKGNSGSFKPGQSGNPAGCPKIPQEFKDLAKKHSLSALKQVIEILEGLSENKDKLRAAEMIMDRAWGKSQQSIDVVATTVIFNGEKELED